jgi:uncharacterized protein YggE
MASTFTRAALALTACLAFAAVVLAQDNCVHQRIITVTGTAEINVPPDQVTVRLAVESHDKDLAAAKANNDRSIQKLLALAAKEGVETKNIQTSAVNITPEYSEDKTPKFLGYQVFQQVSITLTNLTKYEDLLTGAIQAGVNRVNGINFDVSDAPKYREQARLNAVKAAREKAKSIAAELGQTVGKPWEVTEDPNYRAEATYALNGVQFSGGLPADRMEGPAIAGGEVAIRAAVRVSFQLE